MRLLNTRTLKLEEFYMELPPYVILSHTWGKEEVTFQDIQNLDIASRKAGYLKVWNACIRAQQHNFDWIWIDSCCINKDSSAELSEAINSMYQYYEDAEVCYAYLCDVSADCHLRDVRSGFGNSRWFRRGWTLQELLAPSHVVFLDKDWTRIGTRWSLRDVISAITAIPVQVFEGHDINAFSVAQRMSWAALRETTPLAQTDSSHLRSDVFLAYLHCQSARDGSYIHVYLRKTAGQRYVRCLADELALLPSLHAVENMQELTVKENPMSRKVRANDKYLLECTSPHYVRLLPSAQHFVLQRSHNWFRKEMVHYVDENTILLGFQPSADCDSTITLDYHSQTTQEHFSLILHFNYPLGLDYVELRTAVPSFASFGPDRMVDAILGLSETGAFIFLSCEMRGDSSQKTFEINYVSSDPDNPDTFSLIQRFHPFESGFMVPLELAGCTPVGSSIKLVDIYPPDLFGKKFRDKAYVTIPDHDTFQMFRILTYQLWEGKRTFYIALGFHHSTAWTDIIRCYDKSESAEAVWKSYLTGSRVQKRLDCQTSASASLYYDSSFSLPHDLTVSIEERKTLQLGTHSLCLEEVLNLFSPCEVDR